MQIPAELTKAEQDIRTKLAADALDAATYEKSLVAFVVANKAKVIAVALIVAVPVGIVCFVAGKLL